MSRIVAWIRHVVRELRRRRVIRVAVVYAGTGFVILEAADILQPALRLPSWTVRLIAVLLILGFPLAVGLAWVYNITEEGLVQAEAEGDRGEIGPGGKPFTSNWILIGLVIVAIGLLLYPRLFSSGDEAGMQASAPDTAQIDERSIAVLPFESLSSGEKSETFARGVHDDLLTRLSNISDLGVVSRTSVEQYRNRDLPLPAIADSLGVRWVMEGGVLESGGRIQVNAQLIDPKSDVHVWADDYQRKLTAENLFAIQGEITREIANALKAELTAGEQSRITGAPTENLQAYRLYVKGRSQLDTRSETGMRRAVEYFKQALQEDSTFALAWSGLADARGLFRAYGLDSLHVSVPSQEEAARRALKLDPDLAEGHASLGYIHLLNQDGPSALKRLEKALDLKPSYAQAHHWLGLLQRNIGRLEKGVQHLRRAVELNPQHVSANRALARAYLVNGQAKKALTQARNAWRMDPTTSTAGMEITALQRLGRIGEARKVAKRALSEVDSTDHIFIRGYLTMAEAADGNPAPVRELLASEGENIKEKANTFGYGLLHAAVGNLDAAFEAFQNVEEWSSGWVMILRYYYPDLLEPVHEDPRYEELIRKINQQWGLNPDGSIPDEAGTSTEPQADA